MDIKSPIMVEMEITNSCNNKCIFCYNETVCEEKKYMSLEKAIKIIDELKKNEVFGIIIIGGECLLHKNITEIINYISSKNMFVSIITNGGLLADKVDELIKTEISNIQVSLLGPNAKIHNEIVKNNKSFERAIEGIEKCINNNINVSINTPIIKQNVEYLNQIIELAILLKCKSFSITRYIYNINKSNDQCKISQVEFNKVIRILLKYKNEINVKIANNVPLCSIEKDLEIKDVLEIITPCDCAKTWLSIDYEGNVLPCPSLRIKCGSLLEKKLSEIWNENIIISNIKKDNYIKDECKKCELFSCCTGGCKSFSHYQNEILEISDPYIKGVKNLC